MTPAKGVEKYYKWFFDYAEKLYCENEEINIEIRERIEHSLRVVKNIKSIKQSPGKKNIPGKLKEIAALLHDVGRFLQIRYHDTQNFHASDDHAQLGTELIKENNVLKGLPKKEKELLLKSIFFHNKKGLHLKSDDVELIELTEMLRSADKMDISKRK